MMFTFTQVAKKSTNLTIAKKMLEDLKRRFLYVTDPDDSKFDAIFVTATFLNPAYKMILEDTQMCAAKEFLKQLCTPRNQPAAPGQSLEDDDATYVSDVEVDEPQANEPSPKRPKLLSRVALLLKEKQKLSDERNRTASLSPLDKEIEQYGQETFAVELEDDPFDFWNGTNTFPLTKAVACDILCIPASTAPIERVFSTSGESTSGKRNRLTDSNLEREVLLRKNKEFL